jgi:hypothetical protein
MVDRPEAPSVPRASRRHVTPPAPAIAPPRRSSSPARVELREAGAICRSCAKRPARRRGRGKG